MDVSDASIEPNATSDHWRRAFYRSVAWGCTIRDLVNVFDEIRNRPYDTSTFPTDVHDFIFNMIADLATNPNLADDFVEMLNQEGIWTYWDRQAFNESIAAADTEGAFDRYWDAAARYEAGDPNWNRPDPVDLLEGVDFFPDGNGDGYGGFASIDWAIRAADEGAAPASTGTGAAMTGTSRTRGRSPTTSSMFDGGPI